MSDADAAPKEGSPPTGLFAQVCFVIIESNELLLDRIAEIRQLLLDQGAEEHTPPSRDLKFDLDGLTHIITSTIDFECYEDAEDLMLNIVRPEWVIFSASRAKLHNPRQYSPDPRMFFSGMVVCVASDVSEGDKDAIVGGVLAMGGLYAGQMSRLVTHIVALGMEPMQCQVAVQKNLNCKIVLPHWFDDCLRLQRRIDEGPYTLPEPEVMDGTVGVNKERKVLRPDLVTSMYTRPSHLPVIDGTDSQKAEMLSVFQGRKIMLGADLEISKHLKATIEDMIHTGGGRVVRTLKDADTLVCQYREGQDYRTASTQGKTVGNLPWLYHLITHNAWTSPMRRLLHYPFVRGGLPGFDKFRLSLSNYSGEARVYLENLAKAAGCEFTKTFKTDNTHLITAHMMSEKCEAAKEWNIHIVNHLWLEESYAKWQIQTTTNPRYIYFPPKTNLSEVVGRTPIDKLALEKYFYPKSTRHPVALEDLEDESLQEEPVNVGDDDIFITADGNRTISEPEDTSEKDVVMLDKDSNIINSGGVIDPKTPAKKTYGRKVGGPPKSAQAPKTPAGRLHAGGKENETPPSTSRRSAKDRAAAKLHTMADDIQLYQKEMKRAGGVTHGGRRRQEDVVQPNRLSSRKRSASAEDGPATSDSEDDDGPQQKKARGGPIMRLLITGWDQARASQAKAALRDLGIMLVEDYTKCTHVAAAKIVRTKKFICALAYAPTIVSIAFVEECLKKKELLDVDKYLLKDTAGEKSYGIRLGVSVERARKNKRKLLEGMSIYVTKDVHGGFDTYEEIIRANGGTPFLYQARPGAIPSKRAETDDKADDGSDNTLYLVRGESAAEVKLGEKFRKAAEERHWQPQVVKTDWLLDAALAQELKWKDSYELK